MTTYFDAKKPLTLRLLSLFVALCGSFTQFWKEGPFEGGAEVLDGQRGRNGREVSKEAGCYVPHYLSQNRGKNLKLTEPTSNTLQHSIPLKRLT